MREPEVVILGRDSLSTRIVGNAIRAQFTLKKAILEEAPSRFAMLRRRAGKLGLRTVAGQAAFQLLVAPLLRLQSRTRIAEIKKAYELDDSPLPESLLARVSSVNAKDAVSLLQTLQPAVVVVNGTRILSESTLNAVHATFINVHAGITPMYRGVHGGYWALASRDREHCGVTVHLVDKGIDTGAILAQAAIQPGVRDNFATYPLLQLAAGLPLLLDSIREAFAGAPRPVTGPAEISRLWSHPTIGEYFRNRLRLGVK